MNNIIQNIVITCTALAAVFSPSCTPESSSSGQKEKPRIVAASFPEYDWVRNILGDRADAFDLTLLIDEGTDLHSFQPTVRDIATISKSHLLIHNGGISDAWVKDVLRQVNRDQVKSLSLMKAIESKGINMEDSACSHVHHDTHDHSCSAGCSHDHANSHEHSCSATCSHDHSTPQEHSCSDGCSHHHTPDADLVAGDEHIWLSLKNAVIACERIEDELSRLDPAHAELYEKNKNDYIESLRELDARYKELIAAAPRDTVIICDRFPFRYLLRDYGIKHYAAFEGCSAESEASFQTIALLSEKVKQLQPHKLFIVKGGMNDLAEAVIRNSKLPSVQIDQLNAMQAVKDLSTSSYYAMMENNLKKLYSALSK